MEQILGRRLAVQFLGKLRHYAQNGFDRYEGSNRVVRHKQRGVYAIEFRADMFRVLGFYDRRPAAFVIMDVFKKKKHRWSVPDTNRLKAVVKIKEEGCWERRTHE